MKPRTIIVLLFFLAVLSIGCLAPRAKALAKYPTDDAYVDSYNHAVNYGAVDLLRVENYSTINIAYFKFSTAGMVGDVTFYFCAEPIIGFVIFVFEIWICGSSWSEGMLTYDNRPALLSKIGEITVPTFNKYNISLTGYISGGVTSLAIICHETTYGEFCQVASKEYETEAYRPHINNKDGDPTDGSIPWLPFPLLIALIAVVMTIQSCFRNKPYVPSVIPRE